MRKAFALAVMATSFISPLAFASEQSTPYRPNEGYVLMQDMNLEADDSSMVHLPQNSRFFVDDGYTDEETGQRFIQVALDTGFKFWTAFESFDQALYVAEGQYAAKGNGSGVGAIWWKPGWRSLRKGHRRCHQGWDIAYPTGSKIEARVETGKVVQAGWVSGYGKCVTIHHADGMMSRYAHLSSISVSNGQTVNKGQLIGRSGCTGRCSGPHLHYEHRKIGMSVCGGRKS